MPFIHIEQAIFVHYVWWWLPSTEIRVWVTLTITILHLILQELQKRSTQRSSIHINVVHKDEMIFYKLLCIPPNLEIFLTSVYSFWCLCSKEVLSFDRLLDKINVVSFILVTLIWLTKSCGPTKLFFLQCWSTNNLEDNLIVVYLRYAVSSVHIFQFIFAYVMLAAAIMTM